MDRLDLQSNIGEKISMTISCNADMKQAPIRPAIVVLDVSRIAEAYEYITVIPENCLNMCIAEVMNSKNNILESLSEDNILE
jgi:hypothetical protein